MSRNTKKRPEDSNKEFPRRLRGLMKATDTKQEDLAALLGVTRQSISNYCNGVSPDWEDIVKIAEYFSVSVNYLLGTSEGKSINPCAADDLGLSDAAIQRIQALTHGPHKHLFEELLLTTEFDYLLSDLQSYLAAAKAGVMIHRARDFWNEKDRIFLDALPPHISSDVKFDYLVRSDQVFWQLCNKAAESGRYDSYLVHALRAQCQLDELQHQSSYGNELKHYLHDPAGDSVLLSELCKRVLDDQFHSLLNELSPDCEEIFSPEEVHAILTTIQQAFTDAVKNISRGADNGND